MAHNRRSPRNGFTLLELLVALAVFSLAALALLRATGMAVRTSAHLTARDAADLIAANQMVALQATLRPPARGMASGQAQMGSVTAAYQTIVMPTADAHVLKLMVRVTIPGGSQSVTHVAYRTVPTTP